MTKKNVFIVLEIKLLFRGTNFCLCSEMAFSEEDELLLNVTFNSLGFNSENVESNSLGKRSALADSDNITFSDSGECG